MMVFFCGGARIANAQIVDSASALTIAQMEQIVLDLRQQVARIIAIIRARDSTAFAGWKTYRNASYGFEVKYPAGYKEIAGQFNDQKAVVAAFSDPTPKVEQTADGLTIHVNHGTVSVEATDDSADDCVFTSAAQQEAKMKTFAGTKNINGVAFYHYKNYPAYIGGYCGMSTGCHYMDIYRAYQNGTCFDITYQRSDRADYLGVINDTSVKFVVEAIPDVFTQIALTFKFSGLSKKIDTVNEIFPIDADVTTCTNSNGKTLSAASVVDYADWFVWNGCAKDKYYNVATNQPVVLSVHGDTCATCQCQYPQFTVGENNSSAGGKQGNYNIVADIDILDTPSTAVAIGNTHNYLYYPKSGQIRIEAQSCFYLRVYRGDLSALQQKFSDLEPLPLASGQIQVTIMVPENESAYADAVIGSNFIIDNPAYKWPFKKKTMNVPYSADIIRASAEAAAEEIPTKGGPAHATINYLKVENNIAYVLLNIDEDGWAGVSYSKALIHPLVEKTLMQFPQIKKIIWDNAPEK